MPDVNRYYEAGVGSSVEVVIKRTDRGKLEPYILEVQPGCALTITLTAREADFRKKPVGVFAQIFDPNGKLVGVLDGNNPVFSRPEPQAGSWTIRVTLHGLAPSAELNAGAVSRGMLKQPKAGGGGFRCGACKTLLKAMVVALAFHIWGWIAAGKAAGTALAYIGKHFPAVLGTLAFLVPDKLQDKLLDVLKENIEEPTKMLLQRVCNVLGQCPPLGEVVAT